MTEMEEREPEIPETEDLEIEPADTVNPADEVHPAVVYEPAFGDVEEPAKKAEDRPALTIVVQSWATPVVGILMLVAGLLGGYFGRPLVARQAPEPTAQVAAAAPTAASSSQSPDSGELMRVISEQTRHFIGSEEAPVTIIEFSDFQ